MGHSPRKFLKTGRLVYAKRDRYSCVAELEIDDSYPMFLILNCFLQAFNEFHANLSGRNQ